MAASLDHLRAVARVEQDCDDLHEDDLALYAKEYTHCHIDLSERLMSDDPGDRLFIGDESYVLRPVGPPFAAVELWVAHQDSVIRLSKEIRGESDAPGLLIESRWDFMPGLRKRRAAKLAATILASPNLTITEFARPQEFLDYEVLDEMRRADISGSSSSLAIRQRTETGFDPVRKGMRPNVYLVNDDEEIQSWQAHQNGLEMATSVEAMKRALKMIRAGDRIAPRKL